MKRIIDKAYRHIEANREEYVICIRNIEEDYQEDIAKCKPEYHPFLRHHRDWRVVNQVQNIYTEDEENYIDTTNDYMMDMYIEVINDRLTN